MTAINLLPTTEPSPMPPGINTLTYVHGLSPDQWAALPFPSEQGTTREWKFHEVGASRVVFFRPDGNPASPPATACLSRSDALDIFFTLTSMEPTADTERCIAILHAALNGGAS